MNSLEWCYFWFGTAVFAAICNFVEESRRRRLLITATAEASTLVLSKAHPFPSNVVPAIPTANGVQLSLKVAHRNVKNRYYGMGAAPLLKGVAVVAAVLIAIVTGMLAWNDGAVTKGHDAGSPLALRHASTTQATRDLGLHRVLYYRYTEATGTSDASLLLPEDFRVALADGSSERLSELQPGQRILAGHNVVGVIQHVGESFIPHGPLGAPDNPLTTEFRRVTGTVKHRTHTLIDLEFGGEKISTTPEHPFWKSRRSDWLAAGKLSVGDLLVTASGSVIPIDRINVRHGEFTVYNFEVEGAHNYFVGHNGILVHNMCAAEPSDIARAKKLRDEYEDLIKTMAPSEELKKALQEIMDEINKLFETNMRWDEWADKMRGLR